MGEVIGFSGGTRLDIDPDEMLQKNIGEYKSVILIGYNQDDNLLFASSIGDRAECLWIAEKFKQFLLREDEE